MSEVEPLGPSPIVDAPEPGQSRQTFGYIVRWRARRQFLDTATALVPQLLPSLLTENTVALAFESWVSDRRVTYPDAPHLHGSFFEHLLFSRNDDLFFGVDWSKFDPSMDPRVQQLPDNQQEFLRNLGHDGIVAAWRARRVEPVYLDIPVWQALSLFSQSESDGDTEQELLRSGSPLLWHLISSWTRRWHLNRPWGHMVAIATVCVAARCTSNGDPVPVELSVPNRWESWYVEQTGTFAGPEPAKRPQRRRSAQGDHMEWLVQRHFMRRAAADIATENGVSQVAIDKKTRQLAEFIGLDLQLASVGRPKRQTARTIIVPRQN